MIRSRHSRAQRPAPDLPPVELSVVLVVHDMGRELPRTLHTLTAGQRSLTDKLVEYIVVDNGSAQPVDPALRERHPDLRVLRIDDAAPSPVHAANRGIAEARGATIGLFIDGARMASPGLLAGALLGQRLYPRVAVTCPRFHLGATTHMDAEAASYDQRAEDRLLETTDWETDGYELFAIATLAGSSSRGIFGIKGESNSLFMSRELWDEVDGLDPGFTMPGGGLANHDLYRRVCELADIELVELLGEGTFHQYHGGAATSRRFTWDKMHADYVAVRGQPHVPPPNIATHLGSMHPAALPHLERSIQLAMERVRRKR